VPSRGTPHACEPYMMKKMPTVLALVATTLTIVSGCSAEIADEEADQTESLARGASRVEVVFSAPLGDGKPDLALENYLIAMIRQAAPGSTIRGSFYHFTRQNVAKELAAASERRVDVKLVLNTPSLDSDDDDPRDEPSALEGLEAVLPQGSITYCTRGRGACIGNGINHNKFMLFSRLTDGTTNVVIQSSANITSSKMHNNAVVVRGDKALYDGYVSYFGDLRRRDFNLNYYREIAGEKVVAYLSPRASGDTIISVLDNVRCRRGESKIRLAMAFFSEGRDEIAGRLVSLRQKGCDVSVVLRDGGPGSSQSIVRQLRKGGVEVSLYPVSSGNNVHSKYLLIDSPYQAGSNDARSRKLVYTGSHNYTKGALRSNDEVLLRVDDSVVFASFSQNWRTIRAQSK
jgi:phosphatidylserine/phosphatidylglycerophosphate/cardiolipin synthase-like enzyme